MRTTASRAQVATRCHARPASFFETSRVNWPRNSCLQSAPAHAAFLEHPRAALGQDIQLPVLGQQLHIHRVPNLLPGLARERPLSFVNRPLCPPSNAVRIASSVASGSVQTRFVIFFPRQTASPRSPAENPPGSRSARSPPARSPSACPGCIRTGACPKTADAKYVEVRSTTERSNSVSQRARKNEKNARLCAASLSDSGTACRRRSPPSDCPAGRASRCARRCNRFAARIDQLVTQASSTRPASACPDGSAATGHARTDPATGPTISASQHIGAAGDSARGTSQEFRRLVLGEQRMRIVDLPEIQHLTLNHAAVAVANVLRSSSGSVSWIARTWTHSMPQSTDKSRG